MALRLFAEACTVAGDVTRGILVTSLGLETVGSALVWEAETRRLRAQFLASAGAPRGDVEAELGRALAVARGQGARMLELRAARPCSATSSGGAMPAVSWRFAGTW